MKCFRYSLCVLLCFVLCLGVFSVGVNAQEIDTICVDVTYNFYGTSSNGTPLFNTKSVTVYPNNDNIEKTETSNGVSSSILSNGVRFQQQYILRKSNNTPLIVGENPVTIRMNNFYHSYLISANDFAYSQYFNRPSALMYTIVYVDGVRETHSADLSNFTYKDGNRYLNFDISFTPSADVQHIEFYSEVRLNLNSLSNKTYSHYTINAYLGEYEGDGSFDVIVEQDSKEAGLLAGLIEWVKSIKETVTGGIASIGEWISNVAKSITELPAKIWEFIETGLKNLFVPDEEFITEYKTKLDTMLEQKLGAVYQFANITFESWDRIQNSDNTNTIEFPKATINFGQTSFVFGGYQVKIVPEGFDFLVTAIKTIVGILCTIAFVNGMRKRYDEVMGGT